MKHLPAKRFHFEKRRLHTRDVREPAVKNIAGFRPKKWVHVYSFNQTIHLSFGFRNNLSIKLMLVVTEKILNYECHNRNYIKALESDWSSAVLI